jgi:hypothetical protein
MLDPEKTGRRSLNWDDLIQRKLGFDHVYFISEATAVPFDATHAWKDGDTIPRRLLRPGDGSHGDIKVAGTARWRDGYWDVTLSRAMDTGNPGDDKILVDRRIYYLAFAVHRDALGSRWHYVSLPVTLGLGRDAELIEHAGADKIKEGVPVKSRHSEIQLAHYGVEGEFAEAIKRQWFPTMVAGVLLIVGFGIALNGLSARKGG